MERMSYSETGCDITLELCALDNSMRPPAKTTDRPAWDSVNDALVNAFKHGGFVYLKVLGVGESFISELCMKSLPGQFRLIVQTKSPDPKAGLQEWWEQGDSPFRGVVRFGDDDWDARMVCSELSVAQTIFRELYECGDLPVGLLHMRSQWEPKP